MVVLGIDPGTAICGYGIVLFNGSRLQALHFGCVRTSSKMLTEERLLIIFNELTALFKEYKPQAVGVEQLFFNKNTRTAMTVGQARGVVLLTAAIAQVPIVESTPLQVKEAVTGYGKAEKQQVAYMVQKLLNLKEIPQPDDVTDALAVAICAGHIFSHEKIKNKKMISGGK